MEIPLFFTYLLIRWSWDRSPFHGVSNFRPWLLLQKDDIWWFEDFRGRLNMIWTLERSVVSKMPKFNLTFNGIIQTNWPHLSFQVWIYFWSLTKNMQLHSFLLINKQTIFRWDMSPKAHLKLSEIFQLFCTDFFGYILRRFSMSGNS